MSAWLPDVLPEGDPRHGQRSTYQSGCRCVRCRASEAGYRADLRKRKARGVPLAGALVSGIEARRRVRQLVLEGYPKARIAAMAGWRNRHVPAIGDRIRRSTLERVQRVARFAMVEGTEVAS